MCIRQAFWIHTRDKRRCRLGLWRAATPKGTIIIFPGRTEYIEKYASIAADFVARDYNTVTIDWRGQGLADRALPDRLKGHVADFAEYQRDHAALIEAMTALALPKPWSLLAHSMGGCIGLRALHDGLPVATGVVSHTHLTHTPTRPRSAPPRGRWWSPPARCAGRLVALAHGSQAAARRGWRRRARGSAAHSLSTARAGSFVQ